MLGLDYFFFFCRFAVIYVFILAADESLSKLVSSKSLFKQDAIYSWNRRIYFGAIFFVILFKFYS